MKRLLQVCALLALSLAWHTFAWATFTCAQGGTSCTVTTVRECGGSVTTCNITVTSTHAGALETISMTAFGNSGNTTLSAMSTDGTWTINAASFSSNATLTGSTEYAYNLSATGGTTTITCNFSSAVSVNRCVFLEFTFTNGPVALDTQGTVSDTACTTCAAAAMTLGNAKNHVLLENEIAGAGVTAINQSFVFTNDAVGNGFAYKLNQTTFGTTPNWTQSSSNRLVGSALAIYEAGARTQVGAFVVGF